MKRVLFSSLALIFIFCVTGCGTTASYETAVLSEFNTITIEKAPIQHFDDLDRGLEVIVELTQPEKLFTQINGRTTYHLSGNRVFVSPTLQYVHSMGLKEMYPSADYKLYIRVNQADASYKLSIVNIDARVCDERGKVVFSQTNIEASAKAQGRDTFSNFIRKQHLGLDVAYTRALEQINWNRIASFLRTEKLPKYEPTKQVEGLGTTALEQTIIRWDVQSRPQGADVFWRVVSKTPDVKSTNHKYLQTTPYEATKALDIRGLTYQNSGNVRIILRCEKEGYHPQEKEFDVRMVLDQEEISAFFRLVKEDGE